MFGATVVGAIASWLVYAGASWLIPAVIAMWFGVTYRKQSAFPLPSLLFGGAAVGIALTVSWNISYAMFPVYENWRLMRANFMVLLGLAIMWSMTLLIFFQFRKMIVTRPKVKKSNLKPGL